MQRSVESWRGLLIYELVGEGNANKVFRRCNGEVVPVSHPSTLIRVSKNGVDPQSIVDFWNTWKSTDLGQFMKTMSVTVDDTYGECIELEEIVGVIQFKPKWLTQSPAAPGDALSCRTCAIKKMRHQECNWCPLDLSCNDVDSVRALVESNSQDISISEREEITRAVIDSQLFPILSKWQSQSTLTDSMSLRDITVIVEKSLHKNGYWPFIVDLDPKIPKSKWAKLEEDLKPYYKQFSSVCRLSRKNKI